MARLALSFALASMTSIALGASMFGLVGCGSTPQTDADESTSAADKGCVYDSTGHVIDCVPPPDPTTAAGIENAASNGPTTGSASSSSSSSGSSKGPTTGGLGSPGAGSSSSGGPSTGSGAGSSGGVTTVCAGLASELATELAAAQACTIGEASATAVPVCDAWVPTVNGCEQPVAEAGSAATKKYLETFDVYAAHCPIEALPCVAPQDQKTTCWPTTAAASVGLPGKCEIAGGVQPETPSSAE